MTFDQYQQEALSTAVYPREYGIIYPALGLAGEAGEVADKIKKAIRDKNGRFDAQTLEDIMLECGDVLWYIAALAREAGYSLNDIARLNIDKLKARRERGTLHGNGDKR